MQTLKLVDDGLRALVEATGAGEGASLDDRTTLVLQASRQSLRDLLRLTEAEVGALVEELRRFARLRQALRDGATDREKEITLSALRVLAWFDTARTRETAIRFPVAPPPADAELQAFKLCRALELILRDLMAESAPSDGDMMARLQRILSATAMEEAKRRARQRPLLHGIALGELIRIFTDAEEWANFDAIFASDEFLRLLSDRRLTAASFLEDVRRIRNAVMHHQPLTAAQVELLNLYYTELVSPIRAAFRASRTGVDPSRYESPPSSFDIQTYRETVAEELALQQATARQSRINTRLLVAMVGGVVVTGSVIVWNFWPAIRAARDPDYALFNPPPPASEIGRLAAQMCDEGRIETMRKLTALPDAQAGFSGTLSARLHTQVTSIAARRGRAFADCVPLLARVGWNPDTVSLANVGADFSTASSDALPPGYQSYLEWYSASLVPDARVDPAELHGNALLYAVWAGDQKAIRALREAGARSDVAYTIPGFWVDREGDLGIFDARSEARRLGDREIVALLE